MTIITETPRLILRTVELDDAEASFAIYSDLEVMRWLDRESPFTSIEQARASIERGMDCQRQHGLSHWAVVQKSGGEMIGHCGFHPYEAEKKVLELVFHFSRKFRGQGYAAEAAMAVCEYAFDSCHAVRIIALTMPENIRAQNLLTKVGFWRKEKGNGDSGANEIVNGLLVYEILSTDRKEEGSG